MRFLWHNNCVYKKHNVNTPPFNNEMLNEPEARGSISIEGDYSRLEGNVVGVRGNLPEEPKGRKLTQGRMSIYYQSSWYAIWTHSNCELLVYDQITKKIEEIELFFPQVKVLSQRIRGKEIFKPLFPGYLFLNCFIDKEIYLQVIKTRGVVKILGQSWDKLSPIPEEEILSVLRFLDAGVNLRPTPYLPIGRRVRIKGGPFMGIEGTITGYRQKKMLFVVTIELLHRSVAAEIDYTKVEPC